MAHTKEKWLIEGNEIMTDNWRMIVKLPDDWANLKEEDKANAVLIVEAPNLLKACKKFLHRAINTNMKGTDIVYATHNDMRKIISRIDRGV